MNLTEHLTNNWLKHRTVLENLLQLIPDQHMNYKPWDDAMTISEMAQHIAHSSEMFMSIAKTGQGGIGASPTNDCSTMAEVVDIVRSSTEKTKALFASLTDQELEIEYDSPHPNFKGPRLKLVQMMSDHEVHHKGQLFVYARMIGLKDLPFFY